MKKINTKYITTIAISQLFFALVSQAGDFDGCKGITIGKNEKSIVDISKEFESAQTRIEKICSKQLPPEVKSIQANISKCSKGASAELKSQTQFVSLVDNLSTHTNDLTDHAKKACEIMLKNLKTTESYCATRGKKLADLEAKIQAASAGSGNGPHAAAAQQGALLKQKKVYDEAAMSFSQMSALAYQSESAVYARLPNQDENRTREQHEGTESDTTPDPDLDKKIVVLKNDIERLSIGNSSAKSCKKLIATGGDLDDFANILKQNLWPNGKRVARSLDKVAKADNEKFNEYSKMSTKVSAGAAAMAQETAPVSGTASEAQPIVTGSKATGDGSEEIATRVNSDGSVNSQDVAPGAVASNGLTGPVDTSTNRPIRTPDQQQLYNETAAIRNAPEVTPAQAAIEAGLKQQISSQEVAAPASVTITTMPANNVNSLEGQSCTFTTGFWASVGWPGQGTYDANGVCR